MMHGQKNIPKSLTKYL